MSNALYTGEDVEVTIDLIDKNFADMTDVIVGIIVNKVLVKTSKKTETHAEHQVIADPASPTRCIVRLFRSETKTWQPGILSMEVTLKGIATGFPDGKHTTFRENIVTFYRTLTKNA